ncbi:MAG: transporter substrate-binding domain-containing protein [Spirochaetales bacterium]|nr:transporter substrate-binding domain-containing protein [Spirochaetales bacterium]
MRKLSALILAAVLLLFGCSQKKVEISLDGEISEPRQVESEHSPEDSADGKPLIEVGAQDTIKIMVRADGAPGMYLGEDGEVHGFYVDLERMIMEEMGQAYELIPYDDVGPVIQGIKSGFYTSALATPDLPDYRTFLDLSLPYEVLHYTTFVRSDNTDIGGDTREEIIASLFGKTVGAQARGHIYQALRDYREIELREYPTTTQALNDLEKGLLDAVPDVERIGLYYSRLNGWDLKTAGVPIIEQNICTSFSQALAPSLLERYDTALQAIINDGRLESLYGDYFGSMDAEDKPWL